MGHTILRDLPTSVDGLNFRPYVLTLAEILSSPTTDTPLTIGVFGTWGSGKTSLMSMLLKELNETTCTCVWFDAWKYNQQETLWRALLLRVLDELRRVVKAVDPLDPKALDELEDLENSLYATVDREEMGRIQIDWSQLGKGMTQGAVQIGLSFIPGAGALAGLLKGLEEVESKGAVESLVKTVQREKTRIHVEQVRFLEQFQNRFRRLAEHLIVRKNDEQPGRLIIFVDDLDRCLPEKALEVLEAIKLFLDVPGCIFVLALDREVIARGIEMKYREREREKGDRSEGPRTALLDGSHYLDKIVQLPFQLPPVEARDLENFVKSLVSQWPDSECPRVFAEGLGGNPRQVKRTINVFLLLWGLAQTRSQVGAVRPNLHPVRLAKIVAIQQTAPDLFEELKRNPLLLRDLERYYLSEEARGTAQGYDEATDAAELNRLSPVLSRLANRALVRGILTLHPEQRTEFNFRDLPLHELRLYFTFTRPTELSTGGAVLSTFTEPDMVRIPAGAFLIGAGSEHAPEWGAGDSERPQHSPILEHYLIGRYPVTNAEYQIFVRDAGYPVPRSWDGGSYPDEDGSHPVVGISWYDAMAFCEWLKGKTNKPYRLASEAEWEKAARGTEGRIFPWGNEKDYLRLNAKENGLKRTTQVGQFSPRGDSPFGIADMAGNVWEWTLSLWGTEMRSPSFTYPCKPGDERNDPTASERTFRVLRGGSFRNTIGLARCATRARELPSHHSLDIGFRVVLADAWPVI
jgi:formylglycine-generating enzyme required for sulfatase activity